MNENLKVVILSDEDSHMYELYYVKPLTLIDNFRDINDVISFCKERNLDIVSDFE